MIIRSQQEQDIWNAAFAAAIITDFRQEYAEELESSNKPSYNGNAWENAKKWVIGMEANELADFALEKYKEIYGGA